MGDWLGGDSCFGILDCVDEERDYALPPHGWQVAVPDDMLNAWMGQLAQLPTYWNGVYRPKQGLARTGVTLIPPESLPALIEVVVEKTEAAFRQMEVFEQLLALLKRAGAEGKFVVNYGV
ncbi:MAG: hypothetical protein LBM74_03310 [Oscillospiraceae bacterium]|jgi:hypothetical protein|nr:hypothetical protein [Oscillospiraceae bacterium]